jgi:hypothetical protein
MTFRAAEIAIGTVAAAIATATAKNTHEITIGNDYNHDLYVGDSAVTVGGGYAIPKGGVATLKIANGDILYAIAASATAEFHLYDFQVDP